MLGTIGDLVHAIGNMVGAMGVVMTGDVDENGLADFFQGLAMLIGTAGNGLGEVMTALGTFLGKM